MDFAYKSDGFEVTITKYKGSATSVNIPSRIDGLPVTSIDSVAFWKCRSLTSITIPNSVTSIGDSAFSGCTGLTSITIPNSVTSIGNKTFFGCTGLTSITLPKGVEEIGDWAFSDCTNLTSITIPNSVTSIGDWAFSWCESLTSITIPKGVSSIGNWAFYGCNSLTSITIPDSVTFIGDAAFIGCRSLETIICSSKKYFLSTPFVYEQINFNDIRINSFVGKDSIITIPSIVDSFNVVSIGNWAFWGCENLTSIIIPEGVTSIGNSAFCGCTSLTSITIPNSVTSIGDEAFSDCWSLTSITIPEGVTSIGNSAFNDCRSLKNIYLHNSLRNIAGVDNTIKSFLNEYNNKIHYYDLPSKISNRIHSFKNKPNISTKFLNFVNQIELSLTKGYTPTLNDSVTKIFDDIEVAYQKQQDIYNDPVISLIFLTNAVSETKVKYAQKFYDELAEIEARIKNGIEALTAPKVVEKKRAPKVKSNPDDLTVPASTNSVKGKKFKFCPVCGTENTSNRKECKICRCDISDVIPTTEDEYNIKNLFDDDLDDLISLEDLSSRDFDYASDFFSITITKYKGSATSVNIPSRIDGLPVTSIGWKAFNGCRSLKSITIPNSVTSIGEYAFFECTSLTSITLPHSVTSIGNWAFKGCESLTSITILEGVTSIGNSAFYGCRSLKSITIPNSVTSIGHEAFKGCRSLKSITIPNSVTSIGYRAFSCCESLTSITIPKGVSSIGHEAFKGCRSLKSITIPNSFTSIGGWAFDGCESLTSITIPEGVSSIGHEAFKGCRSLKSITIPNSVTSIGQEAFAFCYSLTTIHFPNSLRNVKGDDNTLERFRNEYSNKIRYYKTDTQTTEFIEVPNFWKDNSAESQTEPKNNFKYSRTESGIHIDKYVGRNVFISIPENIENLPVESIGYRAFENENLYKVVIPANVKSIVYCAFVSQQPMHVFFKGDSIKMIAQSFLVPKVTFYFINSNIYDDIYQITKNDSKCNVSYNAADFDKV